MQFEFAIHLRIHHIGPHIGESSHALFEGIYRYHNSNFLYCTNCENNCVALSPSVSFFLTPSFSSWLCIAPTLFIYILFFFFFHSLFRFWPFLSVIWLNCINLVFLNNNFIIERIIEHEYSYYLTLLQWVGSKETALWRCHQGREWDGIWRRYWPYGRTQIWCRFLLNDHSYSFIQSNLRSLVEWK